MDKSTFTVSAMSYAVVALLLLTASAAGAIALDSTAGDYTLTVSLAPWISYSNTASLWCWCATIFLFVFVTSVCTVATCNCGRRMYILFRRVRGLYYLWFRPAADVDVQANSVITVVTAVQETQSYHFDQITFVTALPVQESPRDDRMREELKMKSELVL